MDNIIKSKMADYYKECFDFTLIENEYGYVNYSIKNSILTIIDIYILEKHRRQGKGTEFENFLILKAKQSGCNKMLCCLLLSNKYFMTNLLIYIKRGWIIEACQNNTIYFYKDI